VKTFLGAASLALCVLPPSRALGASTGPAAGEPQEWGDLRKPREAPLAQAVGRIFGDEVWSEVQISTNGPVADLTRLVRQGCYKRELIELLLISAESRRPLKDVAERRRKGVLLADLAKEGGLAYDRVYENALAVEELVDREYLKRFPERRLKVEREE
jgi:hypothetical protein